MIFQRAFPSPSPSFPFSIGGKKKEKGPMKFCPGDKAEVFPKGGLEFEPNCA